MSDGSNWGQEPTEPPTDKPWNKLSAAQKKAQDPARAKKDTRNGFIVLGALVLIVGGCVAANGGGDDPKKDAAAVSSPTPQPVHTEAAAASSAPAVAAPTKAAVAPPADPKAMFTDAVKDDLGPGDKIQTVTLSAKRPDGTYDITGVLLSHEAFSSKNAPKAIREAAWHFMFAARKQDAVPVRSVTAVVQYPLTDAYGKTSNDKVYEALISRAVLDRIQAEKDTDFYAINWEAIVQVQYEHPAMSG